MNRSRLYTILRVVFGLIIIGSGTAMILGLTDDMMTYSNVSAIEFMDGLKAAGYFMPFLGIVKVLCGLAIVFNRYAKVALVIFMPVSINMTLFHIFLEFASGIPAYVILALNTYLLIKNFDSYRSMLKVK